MKLFLLGQSAGPDPGSRTSALASLSLLLAASPSMLVGTASAAELIIYDSLSDGDGMLLGRGCTMQYAGVDHDAVIQACTDPWMGAGLKVYPLVNVWAYSHVTFLARAEYSPSCMPTFSVTCGWWPRYSGAAVELSGKYVAGGRLVADEWRQVAIPTADLSSGAVAGLNMFSVNFNKCNPYVFDSGQNARPPFGISLPSTGNFVSTRTLLQRSQVLDHGHSIDGQPAEFRVDPSYGDPDG